jgi:hypothetical protein
MQSYRVFDKEAGGHSADRFSARQEIPSFCGARGFIAVFANFRC